jgi:hypothetical protein
MRWRRPAAIANNRPISRQRGCYVRTMKTDAQLRKKNLAVSLNATFVAMQHAVNTTEEDVFYVVRIYRLLGNGYVFCGFASRLCK